MWYLCGGVRIFGVVSIVLSFDRDIANSPGGRVGVAWSDNNNEWYARPTSDNWDGLDLMPTSGNVEGIPTLRRGLSDGS